MTRNLPDRKRMRMLDFDYSSDAIYFLTLCCKNRIHYFGEIENEKMNLNKSGEIAHAQIKWLENQYPYIEIHNFTIMPNHIHILLEINRDKLSRPLHGTVATVPIGSNNNIQEEEIKIKSIPELIGAYKTTTSKQIHLIGNLNFTWQKSYHDNIIRSPRRYHIIDNYIDENPMRWDRKFNKF